MSLNGVGLVGLLFLAFFGVLLPIVAFRQRDRLTSIRPRPTRRQVYPSVIVQLTFFLILGLLTAWREGIAFWRWPQNVALPSLVTLAILGVMTLATRPIMRAAVEQREPRAYFVMPDGPGEMSLWIAVSVMAGIAEEFVYRWVFADLATRLTGSLPVAWTFAILAFAIAHANLGVRSMVMVAAFSLVAHLLVYTTRTLLFAIVVHAVYDVIAGFQYVRLGHQLGYPTDGLPDAATDDAVTAPPATSSP